MISIRDKSLEINTNVNQHSFRVLNLMPCSDEFKEWLSSDALKAYVAALSLINENTAKLWKMFLKEYQPKSDTVWK